MMIKLKNTKHERGFTLLEILITIVIVGVGLLATGLLFLNGLKFNDTAYLHTQAATLAADVAEKYRSNPGSSASYESDWDDDTSLSDCSPDCSNLDLVTFDMTSWKELLADRLPSGQGKITYYPATATTLTEYITIEVKYSDRGEDRTFTLDATL